MRLGIDSMTPDDLAYVAVRMRAYDRRELAEVRNQADSLIYSTEKNLKDMEDKVDAELKASVEEKLAAARTALEGEDKAAIEAALEELTQVSHKVAEAMYAATQAEAEAQAGASGGEAPGDDDVVDADFEEVKKEGESPEEESQEDESAEGEPKKEGDA